jgi:hypothetical protein
MAIRYGVDFSAGRPDVAAMRRAGRDFVVRYVSRPGNRKNITADEVRHWRANRIDIAIVFESTAGRVLAGAAAGAVDAASARDQVIAVGGPADGGVIYFAADTDLTSRADFDRASAYLTGAARVLGWDQVGVYGEYDLVEHLTRHTPCRWFWQTYAWSRGKGPHSRAQLYQYRNGQPLGGADVDFNRALTDDFGQWGFTPPTRPDPGKDKSMTLTADEHNWLQAIHRQLTGAVGMGQRDFQSTIKAVLGTAQTLVNISRANAGVLGRAIAETEQAVLAAIAAVPTAHLTIAEQQQIAETAAAELAKAGVQVDETALLDALSTELTPPDPAAEADGAGTAPPGRNAT